jgi:hypothetical protein
MAGVKPVKRRKLARPHQPSKPFFFFLFFPFRANLQRRIFIPYSRLLLISDV